MRSLGLVGFLCMNIESFLPFLLILTPFAAAFFLEAAVMFFLKLKPFRTCLGISILTNLLSFALLYFVGSPLLSLFGYDTANFNSFNLHPQTVAFLCWVSIIVEGLLVGFLLRSVPTKRVFTASISMNVLSFIFLYLFIANSH
jgi:hypothetical protein